MAYRLQTTATLSYLIRQKLVRNNINGSIQKTANLILDFKAFGYSQQLRRQKISRFSYTRCYRKHCSNSASVNSKSVIKTVLCEIRKYEQQIAIFSGCSKLIITACRGVGTRIRLAEYVYRRNIAALILALMFAVTSQRKGSYPLILKYSCSFKCVSRRHTCIDVCLFTVSNGVFKRYTKSCQSCLVLSQPAKQYKGKKLQSGFRVRFLRGGLLLFTLVEIIRIHIKIIIHTTRDEMCS